METITVPVAGEIAPGQALYVTAEEVQIPPEVIDEETELVYRVRKDFPDALAGDYLIVELRDHAATGELVLAFRGPYVYLGRYWTKHGLRELHTGSEETITGELTLIGAVTLIMRLP